MPTKVLLTPQHPDFRPSNKPCNYFVIIIDNSIFSGLNIIQIYTYFWAGHT